MENSFKEKVIRFLLVIIIAQTSFYVSLLLSPTNFITSFSIKELIDGILSESLSGAYSYWLLYGYLGFLLLLPFLRSIAQRITKNDCIMLLSLYFLIMTVIPITNCILSILHKSTLNITFYFSVPIATSKFMIFPLLGYYFDKKIDVSKIHKSKLIILTAISIIGVIISCVITYAQGELLGKYTENYIASFQLTTTICTFILIKLLFEKSKLLKNPVFCKVITLIGPVTFGMYFFDPCLKNLVYKPFENAPEPHLPTILVSFLWCIASMTVCGLITFFLRKIPGVKKNL